MSFEISSKEWIKGEASYFNLYAFIMLLFHAHYIGNINWTRF